jgi:hypothetical protein
VLVIAGGIGLLHPGRSPGVSYGAGSRSGSSPSQLPAEPVPGRLSTGGLLQRGGDVGRGDRGSPAKLPAPTRLKEKSSADGNERSSPEFVSNDLEVKAGARLTGEDR